ARLPARNPGGPQRPLRPELPERRGGAHRPQAQSVPSLQRVRHGDPGRRSLRPDRARARSAGCRLPLERRGRAFGAVRRRDDGQAVLHHRQRLADAAASLTPGLPRLARSVLRRSPCRPARATLAGAARTSAAPLPARARGLGGRARGAGRHRNVRLPPSGLGLNIARAPLAASHPRRSRMPITRAQATQLLNQGEMALYDDSRINGLRQLDARALGARIRRARTARDRARDLVQKHALASRARTGSKRGDSGLANRRSRDKAELLADILRRFEQRLKQVERADASAEKAGAGATGKTAGKASTGRGRKSAAKAATKTAATKKTATKKATTKKTATRKSTAKKAAAGKSTTARAATKNAAASAKRSTTRKFATGWAAASTSSTRKATTRKSAAKTAATSDAKKRGAKTASKTPAMNGTATRGK